MSEPLAPDPKWAQINSPMYQTPHGGKMLSFPPQAYAQGFEDGAFALAERVLGLLKTDQRSAVALLMRYEQRTARPTMGWEHEPQKR